MEVLLGLMTKLHATHAALGVLFDRAISALAPGGDQEAAAAGLEQAKWGILSPECAGGLTSSAAGGIGGDGFVKLVTSPTASHGAGGGEAPTLRIDLIARPGHKVGGATLSLEGLMAPPPPHYQSSAGGKSKKESRDVREARAAHLRDTFTLGAAEMSRQSGGASSSSSVVGNGSVGLGGSWWGPQRIGGAGWHWLRRIVLPDGKGVVFVELIATPPPKSTPFSRTTRFRQQPGLALTSTSSAEDDADGTTNLDGSARFPALLTAPHSAGTVGVKPVGLRLAGPLVDATRGHRTKLRVERLGGGSGRAGRAGAGTGGGVGAKSSDRRCELDVEWEGDVTGFDGCRVLLPVTQEVSVDLEDVALDVIRLTLIVKTSVVATATISVSALRAQEAAIEAVHTVKGHLFDTARDMSPWWPLKLDLGPQSALRGPNNPTAAWFQLHCTFAAESNLDIHVSPTPTTLAVLPKKAKGGLASSTLTPPSNAGVVVCASAAGALVAANDVLSATWGAKEAKSIRSASANISKMIRHMGRSRNFTRHIFPTTFETKTLAAYLRFARLRVLI